MSWKQKHTQIQFRLALKQNRTILLLLLSWFSLSALVMLASGHSASDTLALLLFWKRAESNFAYFYESMTDFVVFGLVISVFLVDMRRRIRPEAACRALAGEMTDHSVIFHLSNLGRRSHQFLCQQDLPSVVVDPHSERLAELVRDGMPSVQGSGRSLDDHVAAGVDKARLVLVASDDLEDTAIICSHVRKLNPDCDLIVRCFEDDIGERIARRYRATVISTTGVATRYLQSLAGELRARKVTVVGSSRLARKILVGLLEQGFDVLVITENPAEVEDLVESHQVVEGRASDPAVLAMAGVDECELFLIAEEDLELALTSVDEIREINSQCKIVCRLFHDDAACVLTEPPYNCEVLSTSRLTVRQLQQQGAFKALGISGNSRYSPVKESEDSVPTVSRHPQRNPRDVQP